MPKKTRTARFSRTLSSSAKRPMRTPTFAFEQSCKNPSERKCVYDQVMSYGLSNIRSPRHRFCRVVPAQLGGESSGSRSIQFGKSDENQGQEGQESEEGKASQGK